ncbi:phenylacetate-CoA oxygenase subunit PaaC [Natronococcus sp. JC468]|uniref:1,2-phenylacetyl-CoA epoxidase subunit PaaC n=1 Tax=Natronococcus sp. JC468 TaxID=1961921 RepID=UPI00143C211B|nr:1,2-phenylacetyl-CoA epoxidase subunit PaaC [Natronococcus sp. JC468]NKE35912.1 phenylacetate-CoA oxygenase subunit PaaC [Natronococcus sp. JC468]
MSFEDPDDLEERERAALEALLKRLGDDEFVLAERYTEWQVRAPTLESDLALANVAQDELGHARLWYDVLGDLDLEERDLVYERDPGDFRHSTLVELPFPEGDWADAVLRSYLYDSAEELRLEALVDSSHPKIADRVGKIRQEETYHLEHARNWLERLAADEDGRRRLQDALDRLFPHALTLFEPVDEETEAAVVDLGLRDATLEELGEAWLSTVVPSLESLGLEPPVGARVDDDTFEITAEALPVERGRDGTHTDAWFDLHAELTHTYRELGRSETTTIMESPE